MSRAPAVLLLALIVVLPAPVGAPRSGLPEGHRPESTAAPTLPRPADGRAVTGRLLGRPTTSTRMRCGRKPARGQAICVHWTRSGADAVPPTDANRNGVPDAVDRTLAVVQHVRNVYVAAGYRPPPSDGGTGGGPQTDVYLADVGAHHDYGYCAPDSETDPAVHTSPAYCVLDDDYSHAQFPRLTPLQNLKVTAAHEFFHVVQMGYDSEEDRWVMEATATWAEDEVYPRIDDNRQYLRFGPLERPGRPLDAAGSAADLHEYGAWLFFRYLSEHFPRSRAGMPTVVRALWRRMDATPGAPDDYSTQALVRVLRLHGWTLAGALAGFAAANRRPASAYDEGAAYPTAPATRVVVGPGALNPRARSRVERHLTWWTWRFVPRRLAGRGWRLRLRLDLAPRARGSLATVTVVTRAGHRSTRRVRLSSRGDAVVSRPFSSRTIAAVEVTLLNASTRSDCWEDTFFACSGRARDDRDHQVVDARVYRS